MTVNQEKMNIYPAFDASPDFCALEEKVIAEWKTSGTFEASVDQREKGKAEEYIFFDGPPFANGLPHHGHLLTGYVKDLFARYHTMKGSRVERRFGWDCHGLPAEMEAEKELKISGRKNIVQYGIETFNDYCRTSVMRYAGEWEWYVNRQARWVDFQNDYKTMDTPYMESVIWAFSELYKKGYIYEGFKVMPYSWAAETVLSSSEIRLDDATREKEDKAITVAFKLKDAPQTLLENLNKIYSPENNSGGEHHSGNPFKKFHLLAWTTTPWTLPSNLALAASDSDKIKYRAFHRNDEVFIASANFVNINKAELEKSGYKLLFPVCKMFGDSSESDGSIIYFYGSDLIGLSYEPLFPYFAETPNAFRVLDGSDFIEEGSGTGVVHMAPGFGEDDYRVCSTNGIPTIVPVDGEGRFTSEIYSLTQIETERCILRTPRPEDEPLFVALHTNAEVMETMNDGVMSEAEARADFASVMEHFKTHGYGQYAVFHKETGAFMGRAGLSFVAQSHEVEAMPTLRCGMLPEFWHGGYGSELCIAALREGFMHLGFDEIAGGAVPHNPRAHTMLKRIGMRHVKDVMFKRMVGPYFRMNKSEFIAQHSDDALTRSVLQLCGLNVIKETRGKAEGEPYKPEQLEKYGLANLRIIQWLKASERLIKQEDYKHNYPHCWRTDQPIIYKAMSSWFVDVPQFRDRMVELNQDINWIPAHIKDGRFGKWLENAREWSISRSRFWGSPIPVWRSPSGKIKVFGSIAEIEAASGQKVSDLHRPFIDSVVIHDGGEEFRRVEDVFDCWFESGSMPFAQVHYPFENKDWFESHFPADFIVEYEAQTRGWFYSLMVLAVGLFDKIPFKNCICHGVVLDEAGRKLSKRLKNYMDPKELFAKYGSDALRWFMMSSPIMRGSELLLDKDGKFIHDAIRLYIKPIWNACHFFTLYANADGVQAKFDVSSDHLMDRYILAKCRTMVEDVEQALDAYDTPSATQAISAFVEVLNNWYIRRNKDRFWNESGATTDMAAYNTLYSVLHMLSRTIAPLLPLVSEMMYQTLTGEKSVHLANWPDVSEIGTNNGDLHASEKTGYFSYMMDIVRDICNTALSIRSAENIRVRQPLNSLTIYTKTDYFNADNTGQNVREFLQSIIMDELNVKVVHLSVSLDEIADYKLKLNPPILGKRLPEKMKQMIPASKKGEWELKDDQLVICGEVLKPEEYELNLEPKPGVKGAQALATNDALVALDLTITPELEAEGTARDMVRLIQQARKESGLQVSDRIHLKLILPEDARQAIATHRDYIAEQTLAVALEEGDINGSTHAQEYELDGKPVTIGLSVAA